MSDLRDKVKKPRTATPSSSQPIGLDLTADHEAGKALGFAKLKAFNDGLQEVLGNARSFMTVEYSQSSFALPVTPSIKALPPSKEVTDSFMALLYGYEDNEITQD